MNTKLFKKIQAYLIWGLVLVTSFPVYPQATRLADAVQQSQAGNFEAADQIFANIESTLSTDYAYLIARAYNYSWWGNYDKARKYRKSIYKNDLRKKLIISQFLYLQRSIFKYLYYDYRGSKGN